jgi:hypothetical protein
MDFIERLLGVSPDGGNGSLELLYIVTLILIVCTLAVPPLYRRSRGG